MRCLAFLNMALLALAAERPNQQAQKDLDRLKGTWNVVAVEINGKRLPAEKTEGWKLIIDGNHYRLQAGKENIEGTYRLDPTKNPRSIDALRTNGADKGKTRRGVYRLNGKHLQMCFGEVGKKTRPHSFITSDGSGLTLYVFERGKSAE